MVFSEIYLCIVHVLCGWQALHSNYRMQKRSVVNSHAIDGLIDLLLESVIDARKPLSKTAGSEPTHQCSVPQIVVVCSIGGSGMTTFL